jgi:hypothetical protein
MQVHQELRLSTITLGDFATGGMVGTASATVDVVPAISIAQTTASQTLTLPAPTDTSHSVATTVTNSGTVPFTMHGVVVDAKSTALYVFFGTAWNAITAKAIDFYRDGGKPNALMTGGGTITFDNARNLKWSARFIVIGGGASSNGIVYSTNGYYDIVIPPVGTVIPSIGNAAPIAVTAAGIAMTQWGALYYKLSGGNELPVNSNFVYVGYGSGNYAVTPDMVLVAASNIDTQTLRLGTGQTLDVGQTIMHNAAGTLDRADAGLQGNAGARSGFYQTSAPAPAANWYTGANSWQHLLDVRHSNNANNYAMQFAGSFFDQELRFRKTNNNPAQPWLRIVTEPELAATSAQPANLVAGVVPTGYKSYFDADGNWAATFTLPTTARIGDIFTFNHTATLNTNIAVTNTNMATPYVATTINKGAAFIWLGSKWALIT